MDRAVYYIRAASEFFRPFFAIAKFLQDTLPIENHPSPYGDVLCRITPIKESAKGDTIHPYLFRTSYGNEDSKVALNCDVVGGVRLALPHCVVCLDKAGPEFLGLVLGVG